MAWDNNRDAASLSVMACSQFADGLRFAACASGPTAWPALPAKVRSRRAGFGRSTFARAGIPRPEAARSVVYWRRGASEGPILGERATNSELAVVVDGAIVLKVITGVSVD